MSTNKDAYVLIVWDEIKTKLSHQFGWKTDIRRKKVIPCSSRNISYRIYFEKSEFKDADSILRNTDIDEDTEIENELLAEDDKITSLNLEEEEDICVECNIIELPVLPTIAFVDEIMERYWNYW